MDLKDFHDTVRFFVNKEQGGWFPPEEIDTIAHRAQMWLFTLLLDQYAKTQMLNDLLSPFKDKASVNSDASGLVVLSADCQLFLSIYTSYFDPSKGKKRFRPVTILNEDEIAERLDASILEPTFKDPVGMEMGRDMNGKVNIQLYPETAFVATAYFLRTPKTPFFKYTQAGREVTYDQGGSQQLEWTEIAINKILIKTVQMLGVNISDQMIIQYTELKNQQNI